MLGVRKASQAMTSPMREAVARGFLAVRINEDPENEVNGDNHQEIVAGHRFAGVPGPRTLRIGLKLPKGLTSAKLRAGRAMQTSSQSDASERRSETRASLYLGASLYQDGQASFVKIRNISPTGALIESQATFTPGSLVQLVRGSLIVHALVAWASNSRYGLKFSGSVDVQRWHSTSTNPEQDRIDDVVRLVKAGAVPLHVSAPCGDLPTGTDGLAVDLQRAIDLLAMLGDRLAKDGIVVAQYPAELQNLDIAMQVIAAVGAVLGGETDSANGAAKFASLRKSADQALSPAAA